jgi:ABC-type multidrug transport system fused ATPase/permease subunit
MARHGRNSSPETEERLDKGKKKLDKQSLEKLLGIFQFTLPYKGYFIAGMTCLFLSSVTLMAFPHLTGKLIDTSAGNQSFILTSIDEISLALGGVLAIQSIFSFFRVYFFSQVSERGMADLRKKLYEKYMTLPMSFYDNTRTGELFSRITSDVMLLQDTFSFQLAEFFRQITVLLAGVTILFFTNYQLTLFMLATFPILIFAALFFGRFIRKLSKKAQDALAKANVMVEESLQSIQTVKAFTNERYEVNRYGNALNDVVNIALKNAKFRGGFISFIIFAILGGIVLVMWYGSVLMSQNIITYGGLVSFVIYTMFIGGSIGGLGDIYGTLQKAVGASERILEILAESSEEKFKQTLHSFNKTKGEIVFKDVYFSYPTRKEIEVLKGINISIKAGEKIALVGHSGAGKSTTIQLLLKFYAPDKGTILVDNKDLQDWELAEYRSNLGIVPQEVLLFGGTIKENIAYGKPNATEEEIIEAARKANALEFIQTFPESLNTLVGERGVKLSGGQRQRVAIARAILKDPAILLLDEATSSLDAESERLVQEALDELMKGRTSIIIAHRLATIRKVDRIYVIDKGIVAESGTHEELANKNGGIYNNLLSLQVSGVFE